MEWWNELQEGWKAMFHENAAQLEREPVDYQAPSFRSLPFGGGGTRS